MFPRTPSGDLESFQLSFERSGSQCRTNPGLSPASEWRAGPAQALKEELAAQSKEAVAAAAQQFTTPLKAKKAEQTARAREKLAERQVEHAKRRRISLAGFRATVELTPIGEE